MAELILTEAARRMIAQQAIGGNLTNTLDKCSVHLFTNPVGPTPTSELAELTEATFPGYAPKAAITWDTPLVQPGSIVTLSGGDVQFVCNGTPVTPETIFGAFLGQNLGGNGAAPDTLYGVLTLDEPVGIDAAGEGVRVPLRFQYP